MKTIINIAMLVSALIISGCKEQPIGEPIVIMLYFSFVTAEGGDFFRSDERYDVSKVSYSCRPDNNYTLTLNNMSVFERTSSSCVSIIDFGNGDRDTLAVEWLPYEYGTNDGEAKDLEKVIFTYNGAVIETWNFDPDLKFFQELVRRNNGANGPGLNSNPIVILLPKSADEDELN